MYTKDQIALKTAFANFFGVAVSSSVYEGDQAKANAISLFTEELVSYGQETDKSVNIRALKPIISANLWIFKKRKEDIVNEFVKTFNEYPKPDYTEEIDNIINCLEEYLKKI